ncbi:MAG: alpha-2-macroglobulin [Flavobacteriales bacterium]|nr:alpha-2-macroglobulin [Flavobacteriales bacterium]
MLKQHTRNFSLLFVVVFSLIWILTNCSSSNIQDEVGYTKQPLLIYAKGKDYKKEWTKVDSLEQNGLTKSALDEVVKIYEKATLDQNHEQIIKTLIVKAKLQSYVEENAFVKTLDELNAMAEKSTYPLQPVIHSIIGEMYWMYYQNNRWKFYNRSQTVNFDNKDITTWDLHKLTDASIKHYLLSVKNIDSLKRTPVGTFDEIIITKNAREYRPYLYDFLAHRAVNYFISEEPDITKPAYQFLLDDSAYVAPFQDFVSLKLTTKDTMSLKFYALKLMQQLTVNHVNDSNNQALIDVELKRLKFVNNHASFENKDSLYYKSLTLLFGKFKEESTAGEIVYELAKIHQARGHAYRTEEPDVFKWELKRALVMCRNAMEKYPDTYGADRCRQLENELLTKSLSLRVETANLPDLPIKALIQYKNISQVYHKLVQIDYDEYSKWNRNEGYYERFEKIKSAREIKSWELALPNDGDLREHSGEIKLDALPKGFYVLITATTKDFTYDKEAVALTPFWVSNISYLSRRTEKEEVEFFVLNRLTGEPMPGVKAKLYYEKYNYVLRKYEWKSMATKVTNQDGYFKVEPGTDYRNFYVDYVYQDDRLNTDDSYYQYEYYDRYRKFTKTVFFTDRAIYRPGQTVYFKGIVLDSDSENNNKIKVGHTSTVTFYDVNHQKVSSLTLKTNEYGTFSGSFVVPNNGLNGQMYISDTYGSTYFSVEEYKRPKFEVEFQPVKGSYKLNETVHVVGSAKSYSGANIDGAEVSYRVVRNAYFPYWCYYRWGFTPNSSELEIINGTSTTDDNGEFKVDFTAIPDQAINKKYAPSYNYTVYADVTDINGETHSSTTYVRVGYNALNITIDVPDKVNKNGVDTFKLSSSNLNGEFEAATGNMKVWSLKMPNKTYRSSLWSHGDIRFLDKETYLKDFPWDEYDDENNSYKWEKDIKVYDHEFNTSKRKAVELYHLPEWKPGKYVLEITSKDKFGQDVQEIKYFTVYNDIDKYVATNEIAWFVPLKTKGEPGEKAEFLVGSAEKDVTMLYEIEHQNTIIKKEWIKLSGKQQRISIPIEEKHRGNFHVHFTFVKNSRNYDFMSTVTVPHTNKQLDLEFETFRNKLLPGQKEEWKIKIKGKKGEKVAAEMVATLYDASLDVFRSNYWGLNVLRYDYSSRYWRGTSAFSTNNSQLVAQYWNVGLSNLKTKEYDHLNWFGYYFGGYHAYRSRGDYFDYSEGDAYFGAELLETEEEVSMDEDRAGYAEKTKSSGKLAKEVMNNMPGVAPSEDKNKDVTTLAVTGTKSGEQQQMGGKDGLDQVEARQNFAETAFFYPHLKTNAEGEVIISFTIPEALTKWKFMGLAHTKDLKSGMIYEETVTQKELMVVPNAPRFFREGDQMTFSSKITNLSEKDLNGGAQIFFYDALTEQQISEQLVAGAAQKTFEVKKGKSTSVNWQVKIPDGYAAIKYKVVAKSGNFTDGEEMALPVLTNRMLVTETMPLPIRGNQSKTFQFQKLMNNNSSTLKHHRLTLEFTSNPAWYAIQALPYLMEYPYECAEQTFSRFYANSIASHIANSNPKIKSVFDNWKSQSPEAFLSNLEKNQELKSLVLEETPWVLNAQDESERKKRVGLLFDLNRMGNELGRAEKKLQQLQVANGGWTWFKGMPESRYITQHIVTGMGHLDHLGVKSIRNDYQTWSMVQKAVRYLDDRVREDYEWLKKYSIDLEKDHLDQDIIQYLYARSYFLNDIEISSRNKEAYGYYHDQAQKYWLNKSRYMQGMIALALHRDGQIKSGIPVEQKIMASLKENAIFHDELGMYWKDNVSGYYWYQAPIEVQALLIEAFDEVANDQQSVEEMKVWLLKQKQTQDWKTTKATTEACYALLLRGTDLLASDQLVEIKVGNQLVDPRKMDDVKVEAGTGYFKTSWSKTEIKPAMGNVSVTKKDDGVAWGAMYWQYFEQLDKITPHETPLKLNKKLFLQKNSATGPVITPVIDGTSLKPGDKIMVRIELRVDRDMEYVHMKDMRAAGLEPINVFSGYRYQDGLGYYESTKDASTNFFFDYLRKGTYVFEYPLRVNMSGNFSNGITSIQCMYAPEFASHSEGIRLNVQSK